MTTVMKARIKWSLVAILGVVLLAGVVTPQIDADRYRESVKGALESALGRSVEVSSVRFRLLPAPGFTLGNVTIGEDPAIGAEPVAYVDTLPPPPRLFALLAGRLEFASVDLEDASLNLTRVENDRT